MTLGADFDADGSTLAVNLSKWFELVGANSLHPLGKIKQQIVTQFKAPSTVAKSDGSLYKSMPSM